MGKAEFLFASLAIILSLGCIGGDGGGSEVAPAPEDVLVGDVESSIGLEWCTKGSYWQWANPTTGESANMVIQGIVSHQGRQVCKAVFEGESEAGSMKTESFFDETGSYSHVLSYEDGKKTLEWEMDGGEMTMRIYDEQGNVAQEASFGEGGMHLPGMP